MLTKLKVTRWIWVKAAVGGALKKFAGTQGGQAISKATGQILNPHKAVVYQGPGGFRTFSFTFQLVPKSADEAKEIFNIVNFSKKECILALVQELELTIYHLLP